MNKISLWACIFLILVSGVLGAQTEITNINNFVTTGSLAILTPINEYHQIHTEHEYKYHVFNSTGHILTSATTSCYLHAYNTYQDYMYKDELDFDGTDFEIDVDGNNFTVDGVYPYNVWCNSTQGEAGSLEGQIIVNLLGVMPDDTGFNYNAIILTYLGIALCFILMSFQIDKNYQLVKQICFYTAFAFMMMMLITAYIVGYTSYINAILNPFNLSMIVIFSLIIIIIIWITGAEHIERLAERLFGKL